MGNKRGVLFGLAVATLGLLFIVAIPGKAAATTGVNQEMSFEGKIVDGSGVNLPDGTYNMEFKIYTAAGSCNPTTGVGCTLGWTEDWLVSAGKAVTTSSGTFAVNLDSVAANNFSGIDFNSYPLYLSIQVGSTTTCTPAGNFQTNCGGDGEMKPYILLTSSPYALNAGQLGGISSSGFVQLSPGSQQSGNINISGTVAAGTYNTNTFTGNTLTFGTSGTATIQPASSQALTITAHANSVWSTDAGSLTLQGATTTTVGLASGTAGTTIQSGSGNINLSPTAGNDVVFSQGAGSNLQLTASAVPTVDQLVVDNSGTTGVTTAGINGIAVNYKGGAAAVESAGVRVDFAPGTTSGGTWSAMRIVANGTGAVSGVTEYGIKIEGPTSPGSGTEEGAYIGTGWDIGLDIQSGGIQLAAQNDPAAPAANQLRIYAKSIAGRVLPKWVGPSGVDTPFQASLGFNRVSWCQPAGGATLTTFISCMGSSFTNTGTAANPTPASTNLMTSTRRATYSTGTTAGTVASNRQSVLQVWRGNAAGEGGFFYTIRFATDTLVSGNRAFVGLADSVAAPTNVDPTTNTTPGKIGMAINANTGNWNWVNNVTGSAPTVTGLGASFPVNTTDLYELVIFCPPNGSTITYRVTDLSTGAQTTGSASSNIPAATTFLAPQHWITNNATAAAAIFDFGGWYLESDN